MLQLVGSMFKWWPFLFDHTSHIQENYLFTNFFSAEKSWWNFLICNYGQIAFLVETGFDHFFSRTKIFFETKSDLLLLLLFSNFNPNLRPSVDRDRDFGFRLETISGSNRSRARMRSLCTTSHLLVPIFDLLTILKENLVHSNFWCTTATFIHSNISI